MILDRIIDGLPPDAEFTFTVRREGFHYFCHIDVFWRGKTFLVNSSSNSLETAEQTILDRLKKDVIGKARRTVW